MFSLEYSVSLSTLFYPYWPEPGGVVRGNPKQGRLSLRNPQILLVQPVVDNLTAPTPPGGEDDQSTDIRENCREVPKIDPARARKAAVERASAAAAVGAITVDDSTPWAGCPLLGSRIWL